MDGGTIVASIGVAVISMVVTLSIAGKVAREAAIAGAKVGAIEGAKESAKVKIYSRKLMKIDKNRALLIGCMSEIERLYSTACQLPEKEVVLSRLNPYDESNFETELVQLLPFKEGDERLMFLGSLHKFLKRMNGPSLKPFVDEGPLTGKAFKKILEEGFSDIYESIKNGIAKKGIFAKTLDFCEETTEKLENNIGLDVN